MLLRALVLAASLAITALASGPGHSANHHTVLDEAGGRERRHGHVHPGSTRRADGKLGGALKWSECTAQLPAPFPKLCAEVEVVGTANECSPDVHAGVKFADETEFIFEQDISLISSDVACAPLANLSRTSRIERMCGEDVHLCLNFKRSDFYLCLSLFRLLMLMNPASVPLQR